MSLKVMLPLVVALRIGKTPTSEFTRLLDFQMKKFEVTNEPNFC